MFAIAFLFPDGRFVPRWTRWALVGWAAYLPVRGAPGLRHEPDPDSAVEVVPALVVFGVGVFAAVLRYRKASTPEQLRQTRGLVTAIACWLVVALVSAATPVRALVRQESVAGLAANAVVQLVSYLAVALVPASIAVAVLRYRLYDVDVWVSRTLVYAGLTLVLAAGYGVVAALGVSCGRARRWPGRCSPSPCWPSSCIRCGCGCSEPWTRSSTGAASTPGLCWQTCAAPVNGSSWRGRTNAGACSATCTTVSGRRWPACTSASTRLGHW